MFRRMSLAASLFCIALAATSFAAQAAPITYVQAIDGDLPNIGARGLPTFMFDVGMNTFTGTVTRTTPDSSDSFLFNIPTGTELVSADLTVTAIRFDPARTFSWNAVIHLWTPTYHFAYQDPRTAPLPLTISLPASLFPLPSGQTYRTGVAQGFGASGTLQFDYVAKYTVEAVPVPAALPLLATGIGLMGFMGWRRRKT